MKIRVLLFLAAAGAMTANPAAAICERGGMLMLCFHPTASYTACQEDGYGHATLFFQGGITRHPYTMTIAEVRQGQFVRDIILGDNAIVGPNPACQQWYQAPNISIPTIR